MSVEESLGSAPVKRKRTDSNGGASDSDLSDGWNVVDLLDVPSSDGESVEVIGTDEETPEAGRNVIEELNSPRKRNVDVSTTQTHPSTVEVTPDEDRPALREEMFDSSFCWFLFFAAGTVLVSNLTFMAAENFFAWDVGFPTDSPSFLRDLPTSPKHVQQVDTQIQYRFSWADGVDYEDVNVETVHDYKSSNEANEKIDITKLKQNTIDSRTFKGFNEKKKSQISHFNNNSILEYLKNLGGFAGTPEATENFNQALLTLDALEIGLNDLADGISEHSQLRDVINKQKLKITNTINEIHLGVLRSMDKIANNVANKVHKLETKFENQWCSLEKNGFKEEFSGLFFDCQENNRRKNNKREIGKNRKNKNQERIKQNEHKAINGNDFEVDKDSTGKSFDTPKSASDGINDYYNLLKNENKYDERYRKKSNKPTVGTNEKDNYETQKNAGHDNENAKSIDIGEFKRSHKNEGPHKNKNEQNYIYLKKENNYKKDSFIADTPNINHNTYTEQEKNNKGKKGKEFTNDYEAHHQHEDIFKRYNENSGMKIDYQKYNKYDNSQHIQDKKEKKQQFDKAKETKYNKPQYKHNREYVLKEQKILGKDPKNMYKNDGSKDAGKFHKIDKSVEEMVSKFLRENCDYNPIGEHLNTRNDYYKLKDRINDKIMIPKDLFDNLYYKYCKTNSDKANQDDKVHKNHQKGDYFKESNKKNNFFNQNSVLIEDTDSNIKNIINIRDVEAPDEDSEGVERSTQEDDKVISPPRKGHQQWSFSYEEPSTSNKSQVNGDWFIKAGESRSKTRWFHSRGDWWFDRASHRRKYPSSPDRHKNWQFLRAWARHRCRQRPQDGWCSFPQDHQQS